MRCVVSAAALMPGAAPRPPAQNRRVHGAGGTVIIGTDRRPCAAAGVAGAAERGPEGHTVYGPARAPSGYAGAGPKVRGRYGLAYSPDFFPRGGGRD